MLFRSAGVLRLGKQAVISHWFVPQEMLPAPGQGILAVQCRSADPETLRLLAPLDDQQSRVEAAAERAFLNELDAGCNTPVAAVAKSEGSKVIFHGRCLSIDGKTSIELNSEAPREDADDLGRRMADEARRRGFDAL